MGNTVDASVILLPVMGDSMRWRQPAGQRKSPTFVEIMPAARPDFSGVLDAHQRMRGGEDWVHELTGQNAQRALASKKCES
jgi:hypothetical protein